MNHRSTLLTAAILGLAGVALGALGAHGKLHDAVAALGALNTWETAVRYNQLGAIALLALAVWLRQPAGGANRLIAWAVRGMAAGTVLFSGSLYGLALGGPHWLGPVTPLGGVALLAGWSCLAVAALKKDA